MLLTKDFIVLNIPKTGSTFVRHCVKKLFHSKRHRGIFRFVPNIFNKFQIEELQSPNIKIRNDLKYQDQHGCYIQIPKKHKTKLILINYRDPLERFVSLYNSQHWRVRNFVPIEIVSKKIPSFPDLNISEYFEYQQLNKIYARLGGIIPNANIGNQSIQFIQMVFKNPSQILKTISNSYIDSGNFKKDLPKIKMINTNTIRTDLIYFLGTYGFSERELSFIRSERRVGQSTKHIKISNVNEELRKKIIY